MEQKQPWYKKEIHLGSVKTVDIVTMTKNLSIMLESGLTVPEALEVLSEQTSGKLKVVMSRVNKVVRSGESLGDALEKESKTFSVIFVSSVRIGENSGTLAENLVHLSDQMEKDLEVRRNIQGAMFYPAIVLLVATVIGFAIATFILPQLGGIFTSLRVELPLSTRILMWTADKFDKYGFIITPGFFGVLALLIFILRRTFLQPIVHRAMLGLPAIGTFVHDVNRARFCRSVGTLLESGVPIQEGLKIAANVLPNYVYRQSVKTMHQRIDSGDAFSDIVSIYPKLYPKMIHRMIAVGERSGGLGDSLLYMARFYEQKVSVQAKNFSTIIEPILLIVIGLVVAFVALAIFTPIYSITDAFKV